MGLGIPLSDIECGYMVYKVEERASGPSVATKDLRQLWCDWRSLWSLHRRLMLLAGRNFGGDKKLQWGANCLSIGKHKPITDSCGDKDLRTSRRLESLTFGNFAPIHFSRHTSLYNSDATQRSTAVDPSSQVQYFDLRIREYTFLIVKYRQNDHSDPLLFVWQGKATNFPCPWGSIAL